MDKETLKEFSIFNWLASKREEWSEVPFRRGVEVPAHLKTCPECGSQETRNIGLGLACNDCGFEDRLLFHT